MSLSPSARPCSMPARSRSPRSRRGPSRSRPLPASRPWWSGWRWSSRAAARASLQRPGEADVVLGEPVENDLHAARLHHPFQPVIAVFAAEGAGGQALDDIGHALARGLELLEGRGDRRPFAGSLVPGPERRAFDRPDAVVDRAVEIVRYAEISPAEIAAEPRPAAELALEPIQQLPRLRSGLGFQLVRQLALG